MSFTRRRLTAASPAHGFRTLGARVARVVAALGASTFLGGCVANSSNPTLAIAGARMSEREAWLGLDLVNPGGRNLVVREIEYQLAHGEIALPVADGAWKGALELAAGGRARLELRVPFSVEPLEPDSRRLKLEGTLHLEDRTGFLGLRDLDMTGSPFAAETEAEELAP